MRQRRWDEASALLEQAVLRDKSPATVAVVLPLLRRVVEAASGTERGLDDAGVLASMLLEAGRWKEAESILLPLMERAAECGEFRVASGVAGELINLLRQTGRAHQALSLVNRHEDFTRRAGLGPWTQLGNGAQWLQLLNQLGRYDEVLLQVERLRPEMASLPERGGQAEAIHPWNVREVICDTARHAAMQTGGWVKALELNRECLDLKEARGAPALEVARTRFSDFGPLLRLGRYNEARILLAGCRKTFEAEGTSDESGKLFAALADLEKEMGHPDQAIAHEQTALRYRYATGNPRDCAISHFNLADYLMRSSGSTEAALAHRLAAAVIFWQTRAGHFPHTIQALTQHLASNDPSPAPVPASFVESAGSSSKSRASGSGSCSLACRPIALPLATT